MRVLSHSCHLQKRANRAEPWYTSKTSFIGWEAVCVEREFGLRWRDGAVGKPERTMSEHIKRIGVIGAGIMGHGIAQEFAVAGYKVHLTDSSPGSLQKAGGTIAANLAESRNSPILLYNISFFTSLAEAMDAVDFVVEAVTENLPLKQRLFAEIDQHAPPHAILASNSSSFMPSQLAPSTKRPQQVLVTHYFNPPHL